MKVEQNKMVGVDYKLTVDGQIADQSRPGQPLEFIFGTGMLLPKFEEAILGKEIGESVSFTLEAKDGYGEVIADAIVDLPKDIFMVDGKLAEDILFEGSQVPMSDAQGNRMMGQPSHRKIPLKILAQTFHIHSDDGCRWQTRHASGKLRKP